MKTKIAIAATVLLLAAAPAAPFWGAFFAGIGKAVGKAIGIPQLGGALDGLMPVTVKAAQPVVDAANLRLAQLREIRSMSTSTLEHFSGVAGTLRDLGNLGQFRARAASWLRSSSADRFGTSGAWSAALNGDTPRSDAARAFGSATADVPDWSAALSTLPTPLRVGVRREHASLELADAAAVRSIAVLGETRRLAAERRTANSRLERAALDPTAAAQSMPALLGKVSVGQLRQIDSAEHTNQLLDALLEAELAGLKRDRDRMARSMEAAAEYRALASSQPPANWRMP